MTGIDWGRMREEARLLDSAHRWAMASIALACATVGFGLAALLFGEWLLCGSVITITAGFFVHTHAVRLIEHAKVLRAIREGHA